MKTKSVQQNPTPAALSVPQRKAIAAIASGANLSAAALKAGVHRSTLYEWLNQPLFSAELDHAHAEVAAVFHDEMLQLTAKSLATLRALLDDPATTPSVRLRTALAILQRTLGTTWDRRNASLVDASVCHPTQSGTPPSPETAPNNSNPIQPQPSGFQPLPEPEPQALKAERRKLTAESRPLRAFARNAPCPCRSGKKYKRCCGTGAPPVLSALAA